MTEQERAALAAWVNGNPRSLVRFGGRRLAADYVIAGRVGYLSVGGDGRVLFRAARGARHERVVADLADLEVKVGARYISARRAIGYRQ